MSMTLLAVAAALPAATGDSFVPNQIFISSFTESRIVALGSDGVAQPMFAGSSVELGGPMGMAFGPDGLLYVSSNSRSRVLVLDAAGNLVREIGANAPIPNPRGLAFGPDGDLYVASATGTPIHVFDLEGNKVREIGGTLGVLRAEAIVIGSDGHIFVTSQMKDAVIEFDASGGMVREFGDSHVLDDPIGIALGHDGLIFVASENTNQIVAFSPDGSVAGQFGASDGLEMPIGITIGPDGRVWVVSFSQSKVHAFGLNGATAVSHSEYSVPTNPAFLTVSPFRLKVELSGALARKGSFEPKHQEKATLTVSPGATSAFLTLADDVDDPNDLASLFDSKYFVFSGVEAASTFGAAKRLFDGREIPEKALERGTGSIGLQVQTKGDALGFEIVSKVRGTIERSRTGIVFRGELKSK